MFLYFRISPKSLLRFPLNLVSLRRFKTFIWHTFPREILLRKWTGSGGRLPSRVLSLFIVLTYHPYNINVNEYQMLDWAPKFWWKIWWPEVPLYVTDFSAFWDLLKSWELNMTLSSNFENSSRRKSCEWSHQIFRCGGEIQEVPAPTVFRRNIEIYTATFCHLLFACQYARTDHAPPKKNPASAVSGTTKSWLQGKQFGNFNTITVIKGDKSSKRDRKYKMIVWLRKINTSLWVIDTDLDRWQYAKQRLWPCESSTVVHSTTYYWT